MNLMDSRTRRAVFAFGASAAVVAGGLSVGASAANATAALTVTPSTTSFTTLNYGAEIDAAHALAAPLANATFALKLGSTVTDDQLQMVVDSLPTAAGADAAGVAATDKGAVALYAVQAAAATVVGPVLWPEANGAVAVGAAVDLATDVANYTYVTANYPGTYTFHLADNNGTPADDSDDIASPTYTMTVLDAFGVSASTTDNWAPTVTTSETAGIGVPVSVSVPLSTVTTTDARGSQSGVSNLANAYKALIGIGFTGAPHPGTPVAAAIGTLASSEITKNLGVGITTASGTLTTSVIFDANGNGAFAEAASATDTTTVSDNLVTSATLAATGVTGSVTANTAGSNAVAVKTGTASVSYTVEVTGLSSGTDESGKLIYFTISGTDAASVTTNGTTVDATDHVFSAVTSASGVATLTVTDAASTPAQYTVHANTNGLHARTALTAAGAGATLTATYAAPTATSLVLQAGATTVAATSGGSASISGQLYDQYGAAYQPGSAESKDVTLTYGDAPTSAVVTVVGGAFTHTYTPTATQPAGDTTSAAADSTLIGGVGNEDSVSIQWGSATAAGAVAFTAPASAAAFQPALEIATADPAAVVGTTVTGTVKDASNVALPFKSVTLSGPAGTYFSTANTPSASAPLLASLTVQADASGVFGAYVFTTKAGYASMTATSDAATVTLTGTTAVAAAASSEYVVAIADASGRPGDVLTVTGSVTDAFGNPVQETNVVALTIDTVALGSLGGTPLTTNANGEFSTTFTAGSNVSGTATVTATIIAAADEAHSNWLTSGVTISDAVETDTGAIAIAADTVSATVSPSSRTGAGLVTVSGATRAGVSVDVYAKVAGTANALGWIGTVTADASGNWTKSVTVSGSTTFVARAGSATSGEATVTVVAAKPAAKPAVKKSTVSLKATALGSGRVRLAANGGPTGYGTMKFYRWNGKSWVGIKGVKANKNGDYTYTYKSAKGTKTFRAVYTAPGRSAAGANAKVRVR